MVFITYHIVYHDTLWHYRKNVRIFPDGKVFTRKIPYINNVRCYWRVICSDKEIIITVNFIIRVYLKDYSEVILYIFISWQSLTSYGKHKTRI